MSYTDLFVYKKKCGDVMLYGDFYVLNDGIVKKHMVDQVDRYGFAFGNFLGCDYSFMLIMDGDQGGVLDLDKPCPTSNSLDAIQFLHGETQSPLHDSQMQIP